MKPIILTSLLLVLTLPGTASAQRVSAGHAPAFGQEAVPGIPASSVVPGREPGLAASAPGMPGADAQAPAVAGRQRPPRPEKAVGPDLMAYVFAPIGAVVTPIARDLHGIDAALTPINEALAPITGPIDPALFRLAGEATPPAPVPGTDQPPAPVQSKAGPRK